jgi:Flp pilus assembly protein TadD
MAARPDDAQASLLLGYTRLRQARNSDALAAFQRANQLDPKDIVAICMIGVTEQKLGHSDLAHICYARALTIKPSDEMASQLMARLDLHE